jgi:hypothetical protein
MIATQKLYANSSSDTIPTRALKNALVAADSLDRLVKENAALKRLDSISDKIIDTLVKAVKLKDKQYKLSISMYQDCTKLNEVLGVKNSTSAKAYRKEKFWKRFFQLTTVAAITVAAIK